MLLSRDYVGYMAKEVVKRLRGRQDDRSQARWKTLTETGPQGDGRRSHRRRPYQRGSSRNSGKHSDEMRRMGVSYQEMYKKVKGQLARERKLILR